jgi:O-antigen/teichoic acid export membrane protein
VTSIARHVGGNWLLNALQLAAVLVLSPFVYRTLGAEQNGAWVVIVSWTGLLSLLVLGVPMATVRFVGAEVARGDQAALNRVVATCQRTLCLLAAAALVVGLLLWTWFRHGWLGGEAGAAFDEARRADASFAFLLIVLQVAAAFVLRLPYAVLEAHKDFAARNALMAGEVLLRTALTLGCLAWRPSLSTLAAVLAATMLVENLAARAVARARHPGLVFGLAGADLALVKPLLKYSVWALLLNVGALLSFRVAAIVISSHLPPDEATWFDFGNKFFDPLAGLLIAVGAVVMPYATHLATRGDADELREVYLRWSKVCTLASLVVLTFLVFVGPAFLAVWAGPEVAERSSTVLLVLCAGFLPYLPVRGVSVPLLMGAGDPRTPALAMACTGIANVALSLVLVRTHGIEGVAVGTALPTALFAAWVLPGACRRAGVGLGEYLGAVVAPQVAGAAVVALATWGAVRALRPDSWIEVLALGMMVVLLYAALWLAVVWRGDPQLDTRALLARLRKG